MVKTRFAPEPSGYLHIGHLKAIHINYSYSQHHNGEFILRIDDSNPATSNQHYVDNIIQEVDKLGIKYGDIVYISSYLDKVDSYAEKLVKTGKAYVDDLATEELNRQRHQKIESLARERSAEENLILWEKMKEGIEGCYLRLKIDMQHDNGSMRDPVIMAVKNTKHYRIGHRAVYPMYDFISPIMDSLLGITHVFRSSEFNERTALHNWILDQLELPKPEFHTFFRFNLEYTVLSKRRLRSLIDKEQLTSWSDPLCPTVSGLRNRGILPESFFDYFSIQENINNLALGTWDKIYHYNRIRIDPTAHRWLGLSTNTLTLQVKRVNGAERSRDIAWNPKNRDQGVRTITLPDKVLVDCRDYEVIKNGGKVILMNYGFFQLIDGQLVEIENPKKKEHRYIMSWLNPDNCTQVRVIEYKNLFNKRDVYFEDDPDQYLNNKALTKRTVDILVESDLVNELNNGFIQILRMGYFLKKENLIYIPDTVEQFLWTKL